MNISVTFYETIYYYLYKLIKLNNIFWSLEYVIVRNQYVMIELLKGILLWNVLLGSISYLFFFLTFSWLSILFFMHDRGRKQRRELLVAKYCRSDCLTRSVRKNLPADRQAAEKFQIARSLWYARRRAIRLLFLFPHCQLYELFFAPSLERMLQKFRFCGLMTN